MSAFSELLTEAHDRLRAAHRRVVELHFDDSGQDGEQRWHAWYVSPVTGRPSVHRGSSGEQALRRLVEALR